MAARRTLILSESERAELEAVAYYAEKPYQRERAAALLKIADGKSPHWVARHGLLIPRDPDTVYGWLADYAASRQAQTVVAAGRGRKPLFSPCPPDGSSGENGGAASDSPRSGLFRLPPESLAT